MFRQAKKENEIIFSIGFDSGKEVSTVVLFVSLTASIFLRDLSIYLVPQDKSLSTAFPKASKCSPSGKLTRSSSEAVKT